MILFLVSRLCTLSKADMRRSSREIESDLMSPADEE
jgi:hypothetical protein